MRSMTIPLSSNTSSWEGGEGKEIWGLLKTFVQPVGGPSNGHGLHCTEHLPAEGEHAASGINKEQGTASQTETEQRTIGQ